MINLKNFYHKLEAVFANIYFGFPAKKMTVIGITGTNGKTTTARLIAHILESSGNKVGLATTLNFRIAGKSQDNLTKMTTMPAWHVQKLLSKMVSAGCKYTVIETTSHSLDQHRVWGIPYDIAVFTNLTHEHLDYHETMKKYLDAKLKLFKSLKKSYRKPGVNKIAVINQDDKYAKDFWIASNSDIKFAYGIGKTGEQNQVLAKKINYFPDKTQFIAETPYGETEITMPMPGEFNIYNALAAIAVATSLNIPLESIAKSVKNFPAVDGRMESVLNSFGINIIVDFAHTPDALNKVYSTIKPLVRGKTIAVFGATGERDTTKRPIMGAIAAKYADTIILTNDDPYHEDQKSIIEAIESGVKKGARDKNFQIDQNFFKIIDRKSAIVKGLSLAEKGDCVIITGKGGEKVIAIGDEKLPWSDTAIIEQWLKKQS